MRNPWILGVVLAGIAAAAFIVTTSAAFPDVAATRFDLRGEPSSWMDRAHYRVFMSVLVIGVPLLVAGLPGLFARRWPMLLNIPERGYWLAPERFDGTLAALRARSALLAGALILLLCFVHSLVMHANATDQPMLDHRRMFIGLGLFLAFVIGWAVALHRRFARP